MKPQTSLIMLICGVILFWLGATPIVNYATQKLDGTKIEYDPFWYTVAGYLSWIGIIICIVSCLWLESHARKTIEHGNVTMFLYYVTRAKF